MSNETKKIETFAFVHGAWHGAWCWDKVRPYLEATGHPTMAMDLPIEDTGKNFDDYTDTVIDAIRGHDNIILVGHSRSGNVIPRVANRSTAIKRLVYLCAPVPIYEGSQDFYVGAPKRNTPEFRKGIISDADDLTHFDKSLARRVFYNECSLEVAQWAIERLRPQSGRTSAALRQVEKPSVPADYIFCSYDRVLRPEWSKYVARNILGVEPIELSGDHSPFLSHPGLLARALLSLVEASNQA